LKEVKRRQELLKRLGAFPLSKLRPHEKQLQFLDSSARVRLFFGGNRSGKTYIGIAEALAHAYGVRPWCSPPRWLDVPVPNTGIIVSGQGWGRGVGGTIIQTVTSFIPRSAFKQRAGPAGAPVKLILDNESVIHLAAGSQDLAAFEGMAFHWAAIDEPIPRGVFDGIWRGLVSTKGRIWFTLTPLGANAQWMHELFIAENKLGAEVITASITDNPYLDAKAVEQFKALELRPGEAAARFRGVFEFLSDRVHPQFDPQGPAVIDPQVLPGGVRILSVDPHASKPWVLLYVHLSDDGVWTVYDEWPPGPRWERALDGQEASIEAYVRIMRALEHVPVQIRIMDPLAGGQAQYAGRTLQQDILKRTGVYFSLQTQCNTMLGISRINALLADGKLRIFRTCTNTIRSLASVAFDPRQPRGHVVAGINKDHWDALRYALMADVRPPAQLCYAYTDADFT